MKGDPFSIAGARRLFVFGHPAHELALFGLLQRCAPDVIILTDGGNTERIQESRRGLALIDLETKATYLDFPEQSFYRALLRNDSLFFREVAAALREEIDRCEPAQIFCDAVEFYNPVHDITLPILLSASENVRASFFEIPLVYQLPTEIESYAIQRWPRAQKHFTYELSEQELAAKSLALREIYLSLREQTGPEFAALTPAHLRFEELAPAGDPSRSPESGGRRLRYEWRAQLLRDAGAIDECIMHRKHFLPMVNSLRAVVTDAPEEAVAVPDSATMR